jgi:hypothetical protein
MTRHENHQWTRNKLGRQATLAWNRRRYGLTLFGLTSWPNSAGSTQVFPVISYHESAEQASFSQGIHDTIFFQPSLLRCSVHAPRSFLAVRSHLHDSRAPCRLHCLAPSPMHDPAASFTPPPPLESLLDHPSASLPSLSPRF